MNKYDFFSSKLLRWLLRRTAVPGSREAINGDFEELYREVRREKGKTYAAFWYWFQVLVSLPAFFRSAVTWSMIMFKNYLKITFRNMVRQKGYSFINIAGLSLGITLFILIMLYVTNEAGYNSFHVNLNRIYQVGTGDHNGTAVPMAEMLKRNFPEIQQAVRYRNNYHSTLFRYKGRFYHIENSYFVDPEIFSVFTFPLLSGDAETALREPFSIVLTESEAKKIFAGEDPIGKVINYDNRQDFTVTAVAADVPHNSSIYFGALFPMESLAKVTEENVSWSHRSSQTYLLLPEDHDYKAVERKIAGYLYDIYARSGASQREIEADAFSLRPMKDLYFDVSRGGRFRHGSLQNVYIFTIVGFLILVIACINFINLTTARAAARANEVGVRKVLGSQRSQLVRQFLGESVLFCYTAALIACLLVHVLKPGFYDLLGKKLQIELFSNPVHILLLWAGATVLGFLAGFYPSFYLARYRPMDTLSGRAQRTAKGAFSRKALTVFQFFISVVLIIGALTIGRQLRFINSKDLGFDKEHIIWFDMSGSIKDKIEVFRDRLLAFPGIEKFAVSSFSKPGIPGYWNFSSGEKEVQCNIF